MQADKSAIAASLATGSIDVPNEEEAELPTGLEDHEVTYMEEC